MKSVEKLLSAVVLTSWVLGCQALPVAPSRAVEPDLTVVSIQATATPGETSPKVATPEDENSRHLQQAAAAGVPFGFEPWYLAIHKNGFDILDDNGAEKNEGDEEDDVDDGVAPNHNALSSHAVEMLPKLTDKDKTTRLLVKVPDLQYLVVSGIQARAIAPSRMLVNGDYLLRGWFPRTNRTFMFAPGENVVFTYVRLPRRYGTFFGYFVPVGFGPPK